MNLRLPLAVPSSGLLYEGHFPGRPILPGIGLLDLSMRALAAERIEPALVEITSLRLRKLVSPGDLLEIDIRAMETDGSVRFEVRREAETVASVGVITGVPAEGGLPIQAAGETRPLSGASDLDTLLPHRPPMRFLERLDAELRDGVISSVSVPAGCAFSEGGSAPALVAIEMAAQSAAALETLRRSRLREGAGPRIGYLVGARDVRFARARLPVDTTFSATIRLSGFAPPLSTYLFSVALAGEVFASGTMSTWITATDV